MVLLGLTETQAECESRGPDTWCFGATSELGMWLRVLGLCLGLVPCLRAVPLPLLSRPAADPARYSEEGGGGGGGGPSSSYRVSWCLSTLGGGGCGFGRK